MVRMDNGAQFEGTTKEFACDGLEEERGGGGDAAGAAIACGKQLQPKQANDAAPSDVQPYNAACAPGTCTYKPVHAIA
eukprot:gene9827-21415_t